MGILRTNASGGGRILELEGLKELNDSIVVTNNLTLFVSGYNVTEPIEIPRLKDLGLIASNNIALRDFRLIGTRQASSNSYFEINMYVNEVKNSFPPNTLTSVLINKGDSVSFEGQTSGTKAGGFYFVVYILD